MGEYQNDFALPEHPDWQRQDISVPLHAELEHYEAMATLHGVIDNLRERLAEAEGKFEHERFENSRLHGEVRKLTAIIDRLTAEREVE